MQKIINLFCREGSNQVVDKVTEGAEWVANGEGYATQKLDGTCCAFIAGKFYKRREHPFGKKPPEGWLHWTLDPDIESGHGWIPVDLEAKDNKFHAEAYYMTRDYERNEFADGTYELCGPRIQGNPEELDGHWLIRHGTIRVDSIPRKFEYIKQWFAVNRWLEGVVFYHPDGRRVKCKLVDFGFKRANCKAEQNRGQTMNARIHDFAAMTNRPEEVKNG